MNEIWAHSSEAEGQVKGLERSNCFDGNSGEKAVVQEKCPVGCSRGEGLENEPACRNLEGEWVKWLGDHNHGQVPGSETAYHSHEGEQARGLGHRNHEEEQAKGLGHRSRDGEPGMALESRKHGELEKELLIHNRETCETELVTELLRGSVLVPWGLGLGKRIAQVHGCSGRTRPQSLV